MENSNTTNITCPYCQRTIICHMTAKIIAKENDKKNISDEFNASNKEFYDINFEQLVKNDPQKAIDLLRKELGL